MVDIVDQILHKPARIGGSGALAKLPVELVVPEYSVALGLLLYAYRSRLARGLQESSLASRLKALFARKG
jgi:hypothetical protein